MPGREQDGLAYRTPGMVGQKPTMPSVNEGEYSTLQIVRDLLKKSVDGLSDFNAFNVLKDAPKKQAAENLLRQVEINQGVYDIVAPLLEAVNSAMLAVDQKYKQK